jgi:hypothetical protein
VSADEELINFGLNKSERWLAGGDAAKTYFFFLGGSQSSIRLPVVHLLRVLGFDEIPPKPITRLFMRKSWQNLRVSAVSSAVGFPITAIP